MDAAGDEDSEESIQVREVAGGCICCSAGLMFEVSLAILLKEKPDRLLIEPTGLAAVSGILNTLDRDGFKEKVDIRSIICLMDPARFEEDVMKPEVIDQIESSDVLLASRADLASTEDLKHSTSGARRYFLQSVISEPSNKDSFHFTFSI